MYRNLKRPCDPKNYQVKPPSKKSKEDMISWSPALSERGIRPNWTQPSPVIVPPPIKSTPVICRINKQTNYQQSWEKGDLFFYPNQREIPLLISDSMCRDIERYPTALHIIRSGATLSQLANCLFNLVDDIAAAMPFKLWIILVGGGNDLCVGNPAATSTKALVNSVSKVLNDIENFCQHKGMRLTIAHIMPRPREQGEDTPNLKHERLIIAQAYMQLNEKIKARNEQTNETPLVLSRFLEHQPEESKDKKRQITYYRQRAYEETGQQKIRENKFAEDGVHLAGLGIIDIQRAIHKLLTANL